MREAPARLNELEKLLKVSDQRKDWKEVEDEIRIMKRVLRENIAEVSSS